MWWQRSTWPTQVGQIPISCCTSVVALALTGPKCKTVLQHDNRQNSTRGCVYDPFSSWEVLNIQNFPDWKSDMDIHDSWKRYINDPEAFMTTILGEYRDARR